ncbi:hypothetical protein V8D89_000108 [Ganoderma adspersum]
MHDPKGRRAENPFAASNRHNQLLHDLTLQDVYQLIEAAVDVPELLRVVNHVPYDADVDNVYGGSGRARYFKVNFTSLLKHGTIEFRQHEGTVVADTVIAWACFLQHFVNFALSTTDDIARAEGETLDDLRNLVSVPGNLS